MELLSEAFGLVNVVDRRDRPSHGYRAVHVVARVDDVPVEIQVRTARQHHWAELSEKLANDIDPRIKYGQGPAELVDSLQSLSGKIAQLEMILVSPKFSAKQDRLEQEWVGEVVGLMIETREIIAKLERRDW